MEFQKLLNNFGTLERTIYMVPKEGKEKTKKKKKEKQGRERERCTFKRNKERK